MRFFILFQILALVSFSSINAQWDLIHEDSTYFEVADVHFFNSDTGLVCGQIMHGQGFVLRTTDGGLNWENTSTQVEVCTSLAFVNDSIGFTGGQDGKIYKTADQGITWNIIASIGTLDFDELFFINDSVGFFKSYYGDVFKTQDSGYTWTHKAIIQNASHFGDRKTNPFHFLNDSIGFVVGNGIYKTYDQGNSWSRQIADTTSYYRSIAFRNQNIGFAVGNDGKVLKTTDAGLNWSFIHPICNQDLRQILFINDLTSYIVGGGFEYANDTTGVVLKTINGGETWIKESISTSRLNSIFALNDAIYITGNYGQIFKQSNITTSNDEVISTADIKVDIWPNPTQNFLKYSIGLESNQGYSIMLSSMSGAIVYFQEAPMTNEINLTNYRNGVYLFSVILKNDIISKTIIKTHQY